MAQNEVKPSPKPPPKVPTTPSHHPVEHPSSHALWERYTFLPQKSIIKTAIPKVDKVPYKKQLMLLRAGPRRNSEDIKDMKRRRKSEETGEGEDQ